MVHVLAVERSQIRCTLRRVGSAHALALRLDGDISSRVVTGYLDGMALCLRTHHHQFELLAVIRVVRPLHANAIQISVVETAQIHVERTCAHMHLGQRVVLLSDHIVFQEHRVGLLAQQLWIWLRPVLLVFFTFE